MATINIKTKFDIGDSVFGFVDGEIHHLIIDSIDVSTSRFNVGDPIQKDEIVYYATTTDAKYNRQHRFYNESLFTKDECKEYINNFFEKYGD